MSVFWGKEVRGVGNVEPSVTDGKGENKTLSVYRKGNDIFFNAPVEPDTIESLLFLIHEAVHELSSQSTVIKDINLIIHINSYGGCVMSMFKFVDTINLLRTRFSNLMITTVVTPIAASAATFMALVGDERLMTKNSVYMIHEIFSWNVGIFSHQKSYMKYLEVIERGILDLYLEKSNLSEEQIREMLLKESWFTPGEALQHGFITEII